MEKYIVTVDDQVKAYIKRIMAQLNKWMTGGKISKLVVVITSKETGENVERWQFDVCFLYSPFLLSSPLIFIFCFTFVIDLLGERVSFHLHLLRTMIFMHDMNEEVNGEEGKKRKNLWRYPKA